MVALKAVLFRSQSFIRVADLQSLNYAAESDATIAGGDTVEQLEVCSLEACPHRSGSHAKAPGAPLAMALVRSGAVAGVAQVELQDSQHSHSEPGLVSLVVKDDKERCALASTVVNPAQDIPQHGACKAVTCTHADLEMHAMRVPATGL